ncbi:MAG: manganese-binding transcriptional regulator MntR [Phycisphaerales bacterium JB061]
MPKGDSPREGRSRVAGAARHERVREAHSAEMAEDYVEAIAAIVADQGSCRVVDLAKHFGVSHVTVSRNVGRLVRDGLALTEPYKPIKLTRAGRKLAETSRDRHEVVVRFLLALGLDPTTAEIDAEGIEHHVSPKTLRVFADFVRQKGL